MKGDKVNIESLCGGEFARQAMHAVDTARENIIKHDDTADHSITITIDFAKSADKRWDMQAKTVVKCTTKERQIGSDMPVIIEEKGIYDGNPQKQLPLV